MGSSDGLSQFSCKVSSGAHEEETGMRLELDVLMLFIVIVA